MSSLPCRLLFWSVYYFVSAQLEPQVYEVTAPRECGFNTYFAVCYLVQTLHQSNRLLVLSRVATICRTIYADPVGVPLVLDLVLRSSSRLKEIEVVSNS